MPSSTARPPALGHTSSPPVPPRGGLLDRVGLWPLVALAAVVALLVVVAVTALGGTGDDDGGAGTDDAGAGAASAPVEGSDPAADDALAALERRDDGDPLAKGDVAAPVVMIEWSDFQCPFCGQFTREIEPELVERYVQDGTLRIEWRDFPYMGEASTLAARAARAAGDQGAFWEFHDAVYAMEPTRRTGKITQESMEAVAADLGLDLERFRTVMASEDVAAAVAADFEQGQGLGITGTPTFLVGGQPVVGAQPVESFAQAIETAAAAAAGQG